MCMVVSMCSIRRDSISLSIRISDLNSWLLLSLSTFASCLSHATCVTAYFYNNFYLDYCCYCYYYGCCYCRYYESKYYYYLLLL